MDSPIGTYLQLHRGNQQWQQCLFCLWCLLDSPEQQFKIFIIPIIWFLFDSLWLLREALSCQVTNFHLIMCILALILCKYIMIHWLSQTFSVLFIPLLSLSFCIVLPLPCLIKVYSFSHFLLRSYCIVLFPSIQFPISHLWSLFYFTGFCDFYGLYTHIWIFGVRNQK